MLAADVFAAKSSGTADVLTMHAAHALQGGWDHISAMDRFKCLYRDLLPSMSAICHNMFASSPLLPQLTLPVDTLEQEMPRVPPQTWLQVCASVLCV